MLGKGVYQLWLSFAFNRKSWLFIGLPGVVKNLRLRPGGGRILSMGMATHPQHFLARRILSGRET